MFTDVVLFQIYQITLTTYNYIPTCSLFWSFDGAQFAM